MRTKRISVKTRFLLSAFLPLFLLLVAFRILPIGRLFILSLQDYFLKSMGMNPWIGFGHFAEALQDDLFLLSLKKTLMYALYFLGIVFTGSFFIGLALSSLRDRVRNNLLLCYLSPLMTNVAAAGVLFVYFFQPQFGLFNFILTKLHLPTLRWLVDPSTALFSVVLMDAWRSIGFFSVLFMTGIMNLPVELLEAAEVDGAGVLRKYWHVALPLLRPTILLVLTMCTINSMKAFEPIYVMTNTHFSETGGPVNSTHVLSVLIYNAAFRFSRFGFASANSLLFLVIVGIFVYLQLRFMRSEWEY